MLGRTVIMSMEQLKGIIKTMDSQFKGLKERSHKGGKVIRCEMAKFKMKLNILEILLQEKIEEDQQYGWRLRK